MNGRRVSPALAVRVFEYHNSLDRAARRRARRKHHVDPVRCPKDGTHVMPGQPCNTCAAFDLYRAGRV